MQRDVQMERFFNALIGGDRPIARALVNDMLAGEAPAEQVLSDLFWPAVNQIQNLHRHDQMSDLAHHYSTRLLRQLVDQMQPLLKTKARRNKSVLLVCGPEEGEELCAQMCADLLEADGYDVSFLGGGVANDEIVAEVGDKSIDILCVFGANASTIPFTRLLIDRLHDIGVCPKLQIAVGGGVFNRADGLAEEIGADLWAKTPGELIDVMNANPDRRMGDDQRTVGRKRKAKSAA